MGYLRDLGLSLLAAEVYVHAGPLARWIVGKAIARLPAEERERRGEEWLADFEDMPGAIEKLSWAIGCHRAATITNWRAWRAAHPHPVLSTLKEWNTRVDAMPPLRRFIFLSGGGGLGGTIQVILESKMGWPGFAAFVGGLVCSIGYLTYLIFRRRPGTSPPMR